MFAGMFIFLAIMYPKDFWGSKANTLDTILTVAIISNIMYQLYDIIVRCYSNQEAIDDLTKIPDFREKNRLAIKFFINTGLPLLVISFVNLWLKENNYFGWFK